MKQLHHGSGAPAAQAPPGGRSHVFCLRPHRRAARMEPARERVFEYTWERVAQGLMGIPR